ncbi:hypothetical protein BDF19DRAFT_447104, partial [Syncephalis fuscata]
SNLLVSNTRPLPLCDVRVCCTGYGVPQRKAVYALVEKLGGQWVRNLTDDTTHLIAGTTETEKHKVAQSRNIPVVKLAWLATCKNLYTKGLPVDVPALTKEYSVKVFSYKTICLTGLDIEERQRIQELIVQHGGYYAADLYQYAMRWKINIVTAEWLYESVKQQKCLLESNYPVTTIESTPETDAITAEEESTRVIRQGTDTPHAIAVSRRTSFVATTAPATPTKANLKKSSIQSNASLLANICAIFSEAYSEKVYNELEHLVVHHGGRVVRTFESSITHYLIPSLGSPTTTDRHRMLHCLWHPVPIIVKDDWIRTSCQLNRLLPIESYKLTLNQSDIGSSMAPTQRMALRPTLRTKATKRSNQSKFGIDDFYHDIISNYGTPGRLDVKLLAANQMKVLSAQAPHRFNQNTQPHLTSLALPIQKSKEGVFADCGFFIIGFTEDKKATLKIAIEEVDGHVEMAPSSWLQWTPPQQGLRWYILAPFASDPSQIPTGTFKNVTEYWIERCLTDEKIAPVQSCIIYQPCDIKLPLPAFHDFIISTTGIEDSLLSDQVKRLIGDLGARYDGCFTSRHPLLICGKPNGNKYEHALKWKTPTTTIHWLYEVIRTGKIPNPIKFPVVPTTPTAPRLISAPSRSTDTNTTQKIPIAIKRSASIPTQPNTHVIKPVITPIKRRRRPSLVSDTPISLRRLPPPHSMSHLAMSTASATNLSSPPSSPHHSTTTPTSHKIMINTAPSVRLKAAPLSANDILKDLMESMQGYSNKMSQPSSFPSMVTIMMYIHRLLLINTIHHSRWIQI